MLWVRSVIFYGRNHVSAGNSCALFQKKGYKWYGLGRKCQPPCSWSVLWCVKPPLIRRFVICQQGLKISQRPTACDGFTPSLSLSLRQHSCTQYTSPDALAHTQHVLVCVGQELTRLKGLRGSFFSVSSKLTSSSLAGHVSCAVIIASVWLSCRTQPLYNSCNPICTHHGRCAFLYPAHSSLS